MGPKDCVLRLAALAQLPGTLQHGVDHRRSQLAREGFLLAGMKRAHAWQRACGNAAALLLLDRKEEPGLR